MPKPETIIERQERLLRRAGLLMILASLTLTATTVIIVLRSAGVLP